MRWLLLRVERVSCPDFDAIKVALATPVIFDGRNLYEPALVRRHGVEYHAVGRL
jgi:UDPglucose 6-dehydrogenase